MTDINHKSKKRKTDQGARLSGKEKKSHDLTTQSSESPAGSTQIDQPGSLTEPDHSTSSDPEDVTKEDMDALHKSMDPVALKKEKQTQRAILDSVLQKTSSKSGKVDKVDDKSSVQSRPAKKKQRLIDSIVLPPESVQSTGYKPVQRYDPGVGQQEDVQMDSLKEMFRPQEDVGGFSLADLLEDFELDPFEPIQDAQQPERELAYTRAMQPVATSSTKSWVKPNPTSQLFFPLCLDDPDDHLLKKLDLSSEQKAKLEDRSWTAGSGRRFRLIGTKDDLIAAHREKSTALTDQIRKRHREAARRAKRRPGSGQRGSQ